MTPIVFTQGHKCLRMVLAMIFSLTLIQKDFEPLSNANNTNHPEKHQVQMCCIPVVSEARSLFHVSFHEEVDLFFLKSTCLFLEDRREGKPAPLFLALIMHLALLACKQQRALPFFYRRGLERATPRTEGSPVSLVRGRQVRYLPARRVGV